MRKFFILSAAAAALSLFAMFEPADAATRNDARVANAQAVQLDLSARYYYHHHHYHYRRYYRPYYYYPYRYYYGPRYYYPYGYYYPYYYRRPVFYFGFGW